MRYEAPAVERQFVVRAELGNGQISGLPTQPVWSTREATGVDDGSREPR